jgi:hypothetical protein
LLLIGRLDLGVFHARSNSISLARLIDAKISSECYRPVCVDRDEWPRQNVVWFSDSAAAVFALLELVLNRQTPTAWYWPLVLPSLRRGAGLIDVLAAASLDLPQNEVKPMLLAGIMRRLILRRSIESVMTTLSLPLLSLMTRAAGLYPQLVAGAQTRSDSEPVYLPAIADSWIEALAGGIRLGGSKDPRCQWIAFCALATANPALIASRQIWRGISALIAAVAEGRVRVNSDSTDWRRISVTRPEKTGRMQIDAAGLSHHARVEPNAEVSGQARTDHAIAASSPQAHSSDRRDLHAGSFDFEGLFDCEYAGFGFVVALLGLLSIDEVLRENPLLAEINFPLRVLRSIAQRMAIDREHPLLRALPDTPQTIDLQVDNFCAPGVWQTLVKPGVNIAAMLHNPGVQQLETAVQLLMSRYLYRYARMSLRRLILRPGELAITPTHLDFVFDIDCLDIRIRKSGLDIDPGWVSWLGLVVQFHYRQRETTDA